MKQTAIHAVTTSGCLNIMKIITKGTFSPGVFDNPALAELADLAQFPSYCPSWLFNYYFFKLCFSLSHL